MNAVRVLLVDDHPLVREGLRARLAEVPGIIVVGEAGDAAGALEAVEHQAPALVLMDIGMKQGNGIELTARLLDRHPALRVLMLSMYDSPEYVSRSFAAGARGYVLKEAPAEEIVDAIAAVARGEKFLGSGLAERGGTPVAAGPVMSRREGEILDCLALGLASKQIAARLGMSVRTVETHRHNIRRKLRLEGQAELIRYAVERRGDAAGAPSGGLA